MFGGWISCVTLCERVWLCQHILIASSGIFTTIVPGKPQSINATLNRNHIGVSLKCSPLTSFTKWLILNIHFRCKLHYNNEIPFVLMSIHGTGLPPTGISYIFPCKIRYLVCTVTVRYATMSFVFGDEGQLRPLSDKDWVALHVAMLSCCAASCCSRSWPALSLSLSLSLSLPLSHFHGCCMKVMNCAIPWPSKMWYTWLVFPSQRLEWSVWVGCSLNNSLRLS